MFINEPSAHDRRDCGSAKPAAVQWRISRFRTGFGNTVRPLEVRVKDRNICDRASFERATVDKAKDAFPTFQLGWFPDYPDANDYTAPFYPDGGFWNGHYDNPAIDKAIDDEKASTDQQTRIDAFTKIQKLAAADAPTVPVWHGKQIAAVRDGVTGVEDTFDPAYIFRFWLISKS